jgi:SnoaL-like polyketide cyclase
MANRRIVMANVIEIAKALITAYNEKNWSKVKDMLAADAVYDEKGTHRQIQGVGEIIDAWQGWAKTIPNSKATFVREFASGDTAIFELVWKGVHAGPLQTPTGTIPASKGLVELPAAKSSRSKAGRSSASRTTSTCTRCSHRPAPQRASRCIA